MVIIKNSFHTTQAGCLLAVLIGGALGLGLYTLDYAEATAYLSNDPKACVNCHVMREEFDGWQKSPHHAVATCNDCHVPQDLIGKYATKAEHGYRHSKGFTFQDFHEPIRMTASSRKVVLENCTRCHALLTSEIAPAHSHGTSDDLDCTHCHAGVGHGARR